MFESAVSHTGGTLKNKRVLTEAIHSEKAEQSREKALQARALNLCAAVLKCNLLRRTGSGRGSPQQGAQQEDKEGGGSRCCREKEGRGTIAGRRQCCEGLLSNLHVAAFVASVRRVIVLELRNVAHSHILPDSALLRDVRSVSLRDRAARSRFDAR